MKVRADEHVSQEIVRIVCDLVLTPPFDLSTVYGAGHGGTEDHHWITEFAKEDGKAILSADKDFFTKPSQVVAIDQTGLRVIYLPPKWANAAAHLQAAFILTWWPRIEETIKAAKPREIWTLRWNISEDGELLRKKIDYGHFRKKLRKANRKSRREGRAKR